MLSGGHSFYKQFVCTSIYKSTAEYSPQPYVSGILGLKKYVVVILYILFGVN